MTGDEARNMLLRIRTHMNENRDRLIELDAAMGDGDLGITMDRAFSVAAELEVVSGDDGGTHFIKAGIAMAKAAPSTMGTLMGTGFIRGGKAMKSVSESPLSALAVFFRAFTQGIMERGKSSPGDKTIVDLLDPVASTMEQCQAEPIEVFLQNVNATISKAREAIAAMTSQHGKAAIYRDQTIGKPDPGAEAGVLMVEGMLETLRDSSGA